MAMKRNEGSITHGDSGFSSPVSLPTYGKQARCFHPKARGRFSERRGASSFPQTSNRLEVHSRYFLPLNTKKRHTRISTGIAEPVFTRGTQMRGAIFSRGSVDQMIGGARFFLFFYSPAAVDFAHLSSIILLCSASHQ